MLGGLQAIYHYRQGVLKDAETMADFYLDKGREGGYDEAMHTLFASSTGAEVGGAVFVLILVIAVLALAGFEIWMIVDAIQNRRLSSGEKALWVIGMILLHPIIGIIYYFTARKQPPAAPVA